MTVDFAIGMVEVSGLGDAILMLDEMCKTADVEFCATERKLGGRLVTIVVKGELTAVKASVDAGVAMSKQLGSYKASQVIARPHAEILPFLNLDKAVKMTPNSETAATHVGLVKGAKKTTAKKSTKKAGTK